MTCRYGERAGSWRICRRTTCCFSGGRFWIMSACTERFIISKKEMRQTALRQMARFGLAGCEKKYPDELSGGMRQRAAFLRTTLCEAGIYLLDEPFGALDVITRSDMQDWLRELCTGLHRTILLVTHDTDEAIYLSDRILILGAPGEGIRQEIAITEQNRSREWLYEQGKLRAEIHRIIKEK